MNELIEVCGFPRCGLAAFHEGDHDIKPIEFNEDGSFKDGIKFRVTLSVSQKSCAQKIIDAQTEEPSYLATFGTAYVEPDVFALIVSEREQDKLHDMISRYLGWPPYDRRPVVALIGSAQMSDEEYFAEFGSTDFQR